MNKEFNNVILNLLIDADEHVVKLQDILYTTIVNRVVDEIKENDYEIEDLYLSILDIVNKCRRGKEIELEFVLYLSGVKNIIYLIKEIIYDIEYMEKDIYTTLKHQIDNLKLKKRSSDTRYST